MKISSISNYSFGTRHIEKFEKPLKNGKRLNHATQFFRYGQTDEFIIDKLRKKGKNSKLNIVSAGCSFGEEAYAYALALDDLAQKPNIVGIDISKYAIEGAKDGVYMLDIYERRMLEDDASSRFEMGTTEFIEAMKKRFNENFTSTNPMFDEYTKNPDALSNCSFERADVVNLSKLFEKNSQDAILCRYVLYHLDENDVEKFLEQAYSVLKPGGILCLEPYGYLNYQERALKHGFKQPYPDVKCIFQKPKEPNNQDYFKQIIIRPKNILNNKSNF